jgi:nucleolar complex protein 3
LKNKENTKLPIKTVDGWVSQGTDEEPEEKDSDSFLASDSDDANSREGGSEEQDQQPKMSQKQQILEAKEDLARLAGLVNENPEEHVGSVRAMAQIAASNNTTVRKLAIAAQCTVYKDIIPSYRIRPLSGEAVTEKISKEVRKLRSYEQSLVSGYQGYVKELEQLSKGNKATSDEESGGLASVAISCACNLLLAAPHFNFRGDLIRILVGKLSSNRNDTDCEKCIQTLETLFEDDDDGHASLDAVSNISKMLRAKAYNIKEDVLNTFLHLRLLSEFSTKGSHNSIDKQGHDTERRKGKMTKEKREFKTKRQRKLARENKAIEQEMREADAAVAHDERNQMQADMLKLVFATYFRILKAKTPHLMGAVLEGLAKYSHLINQDFFGDILEALKDLINSSTESLGSAVGERDVSGEEDVALRNVTRESLLCIITAFALLQGQDVSAAASSLHLDLNFFITHLYQTLYPAAMNPDIELSSKSLHLPDPHSASSKQESSSRASPLQGKPKVNIQTTTVLLLRSLASVLLPPIAPRAVPPVRVAAFTKQLMTASLQLPEKSCLAMVSLLQQVAKVHGRKIAGLWNSEERKGDGVFDGLSGSVDASNVFAGTVWEGELLRLHFSPKVREGVGILEKGIRDA